MSAKRHDFDDISMAGVPVFAFCVLPRLRGGTKKNMYTVALLFVLIGRRDFDTR